MAAAFDDHTGSWGGSNQFRLMPTDPLHEAPATADVTGRHGQGGWHWRIVVDATVPGALGLRMENG